LPNALLQSVFHRVQTCAKDKNGDEIKLPALALAARQAGLATVHLDDGGCAAFAAELCAFRVGGVRKRILLFPGLFKLSALFGDQLLLSRIQFWRAHHADHDQVLLNDMTQLSNDRRHELAAGLPVTPTWVENRF